MVSAAAAPIPGRRLQDRMGAAAVAAALACFGYLTVVATGLPLPLGLGTKPGLVAVIAVAAAIGASRFHRVVWGTGVALAAVVLVVGLTPVIRGPAHALVRADAWPVERVDAVVVLSAWLTDDGHLTPNGLDRLLAGVTLARARGVRQLVTSRLTRDVAGRALASDGEQRMVTGLGGAPALRLHVVAPVASTRDEAVQVARLAAASGWRRVAVVTSPSHTRRACAAFERVGLAVTCVPAATRTIAWTALRSMGDRLRAAGNVLYETAATVAYRRRGWI